MLKNIKHEQLPDEFLWCVATCARGGWQVSQISREGTAAVTLI